MEKTMTQDILRIDACMRKNGSYSRTLGHRLITQLQSQTSSNVKERDLADGIPFINEAWIDQVARANVTFRYGDNGPEGLLEDKKAYVIISSGGTQLGSGIGRNEEKVIADAHAVIEGL